ncbi:MAG: hypothetical protein HLX50_13715 [Alteromonadaceae bacterium]|nr:hypothetical protein [Alteromonadaceae bacterium]
MAKQQANYHDPESNNFPDDYDTGKIDDRVRIRTQAVREKMYGKDVRGAMAQAEEISSVVATEAHDISSDTKRRQDQLEDRYDKQIAGNTDVNEVIDARISGITNESFPTLRRRIDNVEQNGISFISHKAEDSMILEDDQFTKNHEFVDLGTVDTKRFEGGLVIDNIGPDDSSTFYFKKVGEIDVS